MLRRTGAVGDIVVVVQRIGQFDFGQLRLEAGDDFLRLRALLQQLAQSFGKLISPPAGNYIIRQPHDFLLLAFVAHFRPPSTTIISGRRTE